MLVTTPPRRARRAVTKPRYPDIRLKVSSDRPLVWVSEVRHALRRLGVDRDEIQAFSSAAIDAGPDDAVRRVCTAWATIEHDD